MIEPPTATQVDTVIRSALHQADERAVAEAATRLARAGGCTRRLDALVFTTLTGHCPAQGEANAEGDEDDCHSRTGRWSALLGKISSSPASSRNASPRTRPGSGPKTAAGTPPSSTRGTPPTYRGSPVLKPTVAVTSCSSASLARAW